MNSKKKRDITSNITRIFILILIGIFMFLPLYIMGVNLFKNTDLIVGSPLSIPVPPTLDNVTAVLQSPNTNLKEMYLNSTILTIAGIIIIVFISPLASYYLARNTSKFSKALRIYFLAGLMVPYVIVYLPLCIIMRTMSIPFGIPSLILIFVSGNLSFSTFMYTNFINSLPKELEESAAIDGAGPFRRFWLVLFPLLKPCTATVLIFVGMGIWNDFMTPLLMGQVKTITVGVYTAIGPYSANWGVVFGYVAFAIAPIIILYLMMQEQFVAGLTKGALKG